LLKDETTFNKTEVVELKLEGLKYQDEAIASIVKVFDGTEKNTFDNACLDGIRSNSCGISKKQMLENIRNVTQENRIHVNTANISEANDLCIEMETGTGKTLVYLKTIYELYKHYGFTKFIILVPSVAIRQGVLNTFNGFSRQLEEVYGFKPNAFEYDSKKLSKVTNYIEDQHPQLMMMTLASFNSEDKILNQAQREDLFSNMPFIDAIGKTNPIIVMDEPQEGMDTDNSMERIGKLNPLCKLRFSATHKVVRNLLYRLTPYGSYKQRLVKKIEVLTVTEKNDEATLKIQFSDVQYGKSDPKAKLKVWHQAKSGKIEFKNTRWLKVGDNLGEITNNPSYLNYKISRINKNLKTQKWIVTFGSGTELTEKTTTGNLQPIWGLQLEWLIHRHFTKSIRLAEKGIKCLSLIFIDKVANYMGEKPIIKNLFVEKYREIYPEYNEGKIPEEEYIQSIQGYYFAQKASGEFADNEGGVKEQKRIYELILKGREELLLLDNPVQFVFSHSALGVGWDNPNVFNIATLNTAFSEIRKRQEIGRGLRICVNQHGQRVYDPLFADDSERINQLTVIPNETYETFVTQYQEEIKSVYHTESAGAQMTYTHKGEKQGVVKFKRNKADSIDKAFKRFWKAMARKTDYTTVFREEELIKNAIERLNQIEIPDYVIEASSHIIEDISKEGKQDVFDGTDARQMNAHFTPLDLIKELSEHTGVSEQTAIKITNTIRLSQFVKNPPRFIHEAAVIIRNAELEEMVRGVDYFTTEEKFPFKFEDYELQTDASRLRETPNHGVYDRFICDSAVEYNFGLEADHDPEVVCFLKLPLWYKIKTPVGEYNPDFGIVLRRKQLQTGSENQYYFVVETKGTDDMNDRKALTENEMYKIQCAVKHFKALGVEVHYKAPVKEFNTFKTKAEQTMSLFERD